MDRREFIVGITLLQWAATGALARPLQSPVSRFLHQVNELAGDLKTRQLSVTQWQDAMDSFYRQVSVVDLKQALDLPALASRMTLPDRGVETAIAQFPGVADLPSDWQVIRKVFGVRKGRAIIPHGHANMVSSHFVLQGELHLRQYDRQRVEEDHLIVRPTVDRLARPGDLSTISDERDNVHWFIAHSETAWTLDLLQVNLDPSFGDLYQIYNLDPHRAEAIGDGRLKMPRLSVEEGLKRYGKEA